MDVPTSDIRDDSSRDAEHEQRETISHMIPAKSATLTAKTRTRINIEIIANKKYRNVFIAGRW